MHVSQPLDGQHLFTVCTILLCPVHCVADVLVALKGAVRVGSDPTPQGPYHTLVLSAAKDETGVELTATEENTELVLVSVSCATATARKLTTKNTDRGRAAGSTRRPVWPVRHDITRRDPEDHHRLPVWPEWLREGSHLEE